MVSSPSFSFWDLESHRLVEIGQRENSPGKIKGGCMSITQHGSWLLEHIFKSAVVVWLNMAEVIHSGSCTLLTLWSALANGFPILF